MNKSLFWVLLLLGCGVGATLALVRKHKQNTPQAPVQQPIPYVPPNKPEPKPKQELAFPFTIFDKQVAYRGTWHTERNLKLDGDMTCDVRYLGCVGPNSEPGGVHKWKGTFHGTWRRMEFSYDVEWTGPPDNLKGTANIDGVHYTWTGKITEDLFTGEFESNRYIGDFRLERKKHANGERT
jgi:hypothetical protein